MPASVTSFRCLVVSESKKKQKATGVVVGAGLTDRRIERPEHPQLSSPLSGAVPRVSAPVQRRTPSVCVVCHLRASSCGCKGLASQSLALQPSWTIARNLAKCQTLAPLAKAEGQGLRPLHPSHHPGIEPVDAKRNSARLRSVNYWPALFVVCVGCLLLVSLTASQYSVTLQVITEDRGRRRKADCTGKCARCQRRCRGIAPTFQRRKSCTPSTTAQTDTYSVRESDSRIVDTNARFR